MYRNFDTFSSIWCSWKKISWFHWNSLTFPWLFPKFPDFSLTFQGVKGIPWLFPDFPDLADTLIIVGREKRKRVKMRGNFSIGKIQIFARSKIIPIPWYYICYCYVTISFISIFGEWYAVFASTGKMLVMNHGFWEKVWDALKLYNFTRVDIPFFRGGGGDVINSTWQKAVTKFN